MEHDRWNKRPGCLKAMCNIEATIEYRFSERERDLFAYAYEKGYDKRKEGQT